MLRCILEQNLKKCRTLTLLLRRKCDNTGPLSFFEKTRDWFTFSPFDSIFYSSIRVNCQSIAFNMVD